MSTLITANRVLTLTGTVGVKTESVDSHIKPVESLNIKPRVGEKLYSLLLDYVNNGRLPVNEVYDTLLDGGTYDEKEFAGLLAGEAYLVKARILTALRITATSYGAKLKENPESNHAEASEIRREAAALEQIGNAYLNECITYIRIKLEVNNKQIKKYSIL